MTADEPRPSGARRAARAGRPSSGGGGRSGDSTARRAAIEQALRRWQGGDGATDESKRTLMRRMVADGDWEQVRREAFGDADWREVIDQAQLAGSLAASKSVPELYDPTAAPTTPTPSTRKRVSRSAEAFFSVHEAEIDSVSSLLRELARVQDRHARFRLVWRGQQDVAWPVASSLTRDLSTDGSATEDELIRAEREMMATASDWGISAQPPLRFFAEMQHMGAPTRLLDASTDPEVAVWFAVEQDAERDERDARVMAWARDPVPADGADVSEPPPIPDGGTTPFWHAWTDRAERIEVGWGTGSRTWSWFPASLNERMRAQRAGFMIESEPIISDPVLDVFAEALGSSWRREEIIAATSELGLPSRHDVIAKPNAANIVPLFTFRIRASAKPAIREYLANKGLTVDRIYPDQAGLVTHLRRRFG